MRILCFCKRFTTLLEDLITSGRTVWGFCKPSSRDCVSDVRAMGSGFGFFLSLYCDINYSQRSDIYRRFVSKLRHWGIVITPHFILAHDFRTSDYTCSKGSRGSIKYHHRRSASTLHTRYDVSRPCMIQNDGRASTGLSC